MKYNVNENLRIFMERKGVTITSLAEHLGQSRQNVSLKFKNNNFTLKELDKICDFLNIEYEVHFNDK